MEKTTTLKLAFAAALASTALFHPPQLKADRCSYLNAMCSDISCGSYQWYLRDNAWCCPDNSDIGCYSVSAYSCLCNGC